MKKYYYRLIAIWMVLATDPEIVLRNHQIDPYRSWVLRIARIKKRVRAACRTNEPQATSCIFLTGATVLTAVRTGAPWWFDLICLLFWPLLAFLLNLDSPIP